jgi:hypothetical protein
MNATLTNLRGRFILNNNGYPLPLNSEDCRKC